MSHELDNVSESLARPSLERQSLPDANTRQLSWAELWVAMVAVTAVASAVAGFARGGGRGVFMTVLCLMVFLTAAAFDAASSRIPNPLTYTGILLGFAINSLAFGLRWAHVGWVSDWLGAAGPMQSLLGFAFCGALGLMCTLAPGGFGGGDLKLVAAAGAILGFSHVAVVLAYALVIAVVYAIVNLAVAGHVNRFMRAAAVDLMALVFFRQAPAGTGLPRHKVPLGVPLFLGLLMSSIVPVAKLPGWLGGA